MDFIIISSNLILYLETRAIPGIFSTIVQQLHKLRVNASINTLTLGCDWSTTFFARTKNKRRKTYTRDAGILDGACGSKR